MADEKVIKPADGVPQGKQSERRWMHIDHDIGERRLSPRDNFHDADKDYFGNLKRFERHDNMAAPPTRDQSGEPGQKKAK